MGAHPPTRLQGRFLMQAALRQHTESDLMPLRVNQQLLGYASRLPMGGLLAL